MGKARLRILPEVRHARMEAIVAAAVPATFVVRGGECAHPLKYHIRNESRI